MSDPTLRWHRNGARGVAVALPFDLDALVDDWAALRVPIARGAIPSLDRGERASLLRALDPRALRGVFTDAFGPAADAPREGRVTVFRPRGLVAVWLPNNVGLLGPLALVLLSLTGADVALKVGSSGDDLVTSLLDLARATRPEGALARHLSARVSAFHAPHDHPRVASLAASAAVRIVFGTAAAAQAIEALSHPPGSVSIALVSRHSEVWIDAAAVTDAALTATARAFDLHGRLACTGPARVVLLDGRDDDARAARDRLRELWPEGAVPLAVASSNILARQWAAALGWDAALTARHAAVLAHAPSRDEVTPAEPDAARFLPVVALRWSDAVASLPPDAHTIGHAFAHDALGRAATLLARTPVKRVVPIAALHAFGPVWDGWGFWRAVFDEREGEA